MAYRVLITDDALRDLEDIDAYIAKQDSPKKADYLLDKIEKTCLSLAEMPHRGSYPRELSPLGIKEYREIYFKPYRIIYRVIQKNIYIYVITDGRRDMQALLSRRLLGV